MVAPAAESGTNRKSAEATHEKLARMGGTAEDFVGDDLSSECLFNGVPDLSRVFHYGDSGRFESLHLF